MTHSDPRSKMKPFCWYWESETNIEFRGYVSENHPDFESMRKWTDVKWTPLFTQSQLNEARDAALEEAAKAVDDGQTEYSHEYAWKIRAIKTKESK